MGFLFGNDLLSGWMFQSMLGFYWVPAKHHGGWKKRIFLLEVGPFPKGGKTLPLTHRDTLINEVVILEGQRSDKNCYIMLQGIHNLT